MFWTDWGSTPHIGRAGLDGQDAVTIVTEGIEWPNGIALDYDEQRIFWADARLRRLESSDINGNNRHVIRDTDIGHPFGIVVHQVRDQTPRIDITCKPKVTDSRVLFQTYKVTSQQNTP